jgi:hypothetical protein
MYADGSVIACGASWCDFFWANSPHIHLLNFFTSSSHQDLSPGFEVYEQKSRFDPLLAEQGLASQGTYSRAFQISGTTGFLTM